MMIDIDLLPEALINMINLNWVERGKRKVVQDERRKVARLTNE